MVGVVVPLHGLSAQSAAYTTVRGRIIDSNGRPIERALVRGEGRDSSAATRSDATGRFQLRVPGIAWAGGIIITAVGYQPVRIHHLEPGSTFHDVGDLVLPTATTRLAGLQIRAARPRLPRNRTGRDRDDPAPPAGAVGLGATGELIAGAGALPGTARVVDNDGAVGVSVLGLSADLNEVLLDGLPTAATRVPRDAGVQSAVSVSGYDVSLGGAAGAWLQQRTQQPEIGTTRTASALAIPSMPWAGSGLARSTMPSLYSLSGLTRHGAVAAGWSHEGAIQVDVRPVSPLVPFASSASRLEAGGIAVDSLHRLRTIAAAIGLPLTLTESRPTVNERVAMSATVTQDDAHPQQGRTERWTLLGSWERSPPGRADVVVDPSTRLTATRAGATLQGYRASQGTRAVVAERWLAVDLSHEQRTPLRALPHARVVVPSALSGGLTTRILELGGATESRQQRTTIGLLWRQQWSWLSLGGRWQHRVLAEGRLTDVTHERAPDLGTYQFSSLDALATGSADALRFGDVAGGARVAQALPVLGASSTWTSRRGLTVTGGVRVDGAVRDPSGWRGVALSDVVSAGSAVPGNTVFASPRFEVDFRPPRAPWRRVSVGAGEFRANLPTGTLMATRISRDPSTRASLCTGDAIPTIAWADWRMHVTGIPRECLAEFTDRGAGLSIRRLPSDVHRCAAGIQPPISRRASLTWLDAVRPLGIAFRSELLFNRASALPRLRDRNLLDGQSTLTAEASRPVFVSPAVLLASGRIPLSASRRDTTLARVWETASEGRSQAVTWQLSLQPMQRNQRYTWQLAYAWQRARETIAPYPGARSHVFRPVAHTPRHQLQGAIGFNLADAIRIAGVVSWQSGARFTPEVAQDIDGDGARGDAAYIPTTRDAADLFDQERYTRFLLAAPSRIRKCLVRQAGQVAAAFSCSMPDQWQSVLNIGIHPRLLRLSSRATVLLQFTNPVTALWQRLGRADPWFSSTDDVGRSLWSVERFEVGRGYRYRLDEQFGARRVSDVSIAGTLLVRLDLSAPRETQALARTYSDMVTSINTPETWRRHLEPLAVIPTPFRAVLARADSLALSDRQLEAFAALSQRFTDLVDALWATASDHLAHLGSPSELIVRRALLSVRRTAIDSLATMAPSAGRLLTPVQWRRLGRGLQTQFDPHVLRSMRAGTLGPVRSPFEGLLATSLADRAGGGISFR